MGSEGRGRSRSPRQRGSKGRGVLAEEELEGVLQNAGLDLVAWRSTRAVDLSGVDLHVVSFADERDEYKLNLQVKFSEVKSEQVRFSAPYPGFASYRDRGVHGLVFMADDKFFVVPFGFGNVKFPELNLEVCNLKRKLTDFKRIFESKGLLFDRNSFPHQVKGMIAALQTKS